MTTVSVAARPGSFTFNPANSAVIVVDMQNDFGHPDGMFGRGGINLSGIQATVAPTAEVLKAARNHGMHVVYLKMAFRADLSDSGAPTAPNWIKHIPMHAGEAAVAPDGSPSRVLIRDTWNTNIVDALSPGPNDTVVYKHRFSGFFETELHDTLQSWGISHLIFTGCTTSVCVDATFRDAMYRDYHCLLLEDCTAEPIAADAPRSNHDASLLVFEILFGSISTSAKFLAAIAE